MTVIATYFLYLVISLTVTVWVARTLHRRGRVFLVECFKRNEELADSINDLLVVGFYLINFGYVVIALKYGDKPETVTDAIELLSTKIGLVLLILGVMHFMNMLVLASLRRRPAEGISRSGESPFMPASTMGLGRY